MEDPAESRTVNPETESGVFLFVDDDAQVRRLFRRQVEAAGHAVEVASSAEEALQALATRHYDAIATDLSMPGGDGLELIRNLQTAMPGLAAVLVTGVRDLHLPSDSLLDRTLVSVIPKPWDATELLATLSRAKQITATSRNLAACKDDGKGAVRLLLIEDSEADAEIFRFYLEDLDLRVDVTEAKKLEEAMEMLGQDRWDLIVADLSLPDARGVDAVRRLRQPDPTVPILVISGTADERVAAETIELGAHDFLSKSELDPKMLSRSLRHALARRRADAELHRLATEDALTGLNNRNAFRSAVTHALARTKRTGSGSAVIFLDLDRFKEINDGWGHHAGDAVLCEVAERLRNTVRVPDTLARLGGDEFAVLLEDVTSSDDAAAAGERIAKALRVPFLVAGEALQTGCSVGIALAPEHGESTDRLLRCADRAMYAAKRRGGSRCRVFGESESAVPSRFVVQRQLEKALKQRELVLYYQPQLRVDTGAIVSFEALLRWRHEGEIVPPAQFIPVLESTDLIHEVGAWVIEEAVAQLARWRRDGTEVTVAVNVSPKQLDNPLLYETVQRVVREYGIEASWLELEITEEVAIKDFSQSRGQLDRLKGLGVTLAVDDFGTGYSSFRSIHQISADVLKIDRCFIKELEQSEDTRILVELVLHLAQKLKLGVVAEGVETEGQLSILKELGCDRSQGFLHGRPLPELEVASRYLDSRSAADLPEALAN